MGEPNVDYLLGSISQRQFVEWMAYYNLNPFGEERADTRAGIVASTVAEVNRNRKKRGKPYGPQDFMIDYGKRRKRQTVADQIKLAEMLTAAFGGQDLREQKEI